MLRNLRITVGAMMSALMVIAVVISLVLPGPLTAKPPLGWLALVVGHALLMAVVIEAIGYRAPVPTNGRPDLTSAGVFQSGTLLRAALAESVGFVALALAFVVTEGGFLLYLVGAGLALLLMRFHAYPWRRPIDKTEEALRRADLALDLREQLGLSTGPIREL